MADELPPVYKINNAEVVTYDTSEAALNEWSRVKVPPSMRWWTT